MNSKLSHLYKKYQQRHNIEKDVILYYIKNSGPALSDEPFQDGQNVELKIVKFRLNVIFLWDMV